MHPPANTIQKTPSIRLNQKYASSKVIFILYQFKRSIVLLKTPIQSMGVSTARSKGLDDTSLTTFLHYVRKESKRVSSRLDHDLFVPHKSASRSPPFKPIRPLQNYTKPKLSLRFWYFARSKGLEPSTSRVTGECSNQLSYDRILYIIPSIVSNKSRVPQDNKNYNRQYTKLLSKIYYIRF